MDRPTPAEYQPTLRWWSHAWRLALMLMISLFVWLPAWQHEVDTLRAWWVLDLGLGVLAYLLVLYRRRWPLAIALAVALMSAVSGFAGGPAVLAAASVATRRRWRQIALVGSANFAAAQFFSTITGDGSDSEWIVLAANAIGTAAILGWGMYLGSRRELIWTLRNRAERAEAEQELRIGQARGNERARIAREMHDVLAHRISQISMQAGALAYREDLDVDQLRAGVAEIRDRSHDALTDLRDVLGVLRDDSGERRSTPQPTYADLACLVAEARQGGMRVEHEDLLIDAGVPDAMGRTVYRIAQEGLTNARKHAPGALVTIRISGGPDEGVDVMLTNPVGFGPTRTPGAGLGLIGLAERAELRGGRLDAGRRQGRFVLHGWIPWES